MNFEKLVVRTAGACLTSGAFLLALGYQLHAPGLLLASRVALVAFFVVAVVPPLAAIIIVLLTRSRRR